MSERCDNCLFWERHQDPKENDVGVCRHNAPVARDGFIWPLTSEDNWCGEHELLDDSRVRDKAKHA